MKKSKFCLVILGVLAVSLCAGGSAAMASDRYEVQNELSSGRVDIRLDEYELQDGKRVLSDRYYEILPGQTVSKIPVITNLAAESYIRVRMEFHDTEIPLEDEIFGMSDDWTFADDGYYYYTLPLDTGDSADVFEGIRIPSDYPQSEEGKSFQLEVRAEAVQSSHLTPDFSSESPWGDIEILSAAEDPDGFTDKEVSGENLKLIYEGSSSKFLSSADDFFENIPSLYPGDSYSDTLHISNTSSSGLRLYFTQKITEDTGLLEKLRLKLSWNSEEGNRTIYDGIMNTDALDTDYLLSTIAAGKDADLIFTVTMPEELNNVYADRLEHVTWIFRTEEIPSDTGRAIISRVKSVFTGDASHIGAWMFLTGTALFAICAGIMLHEKTIRKNDSER